KARIVFLIGIFFLFCTIGLAGDVADMERQPITGFLLRTLLIAVFAMGYASAGTALRGESWKVMVPMFLVQFFLFNRLHAWFPLLPRLEAMNAEQLTAMEDRLAWDAVGAIFATLIGYACFVYASVTEGRRYFRAHAEIKLAQEIHQVLVPTIDTRLGDFEFYGRSAPSGEVGGDLIDVAGAAGKWVGDRVGGSGRWGGARVGVGMVWSASPVPLCWGWE